MSRDSKNREIVERCSIGRTSLIELSWGKSRGEVMYRGHVVKGKWEERCIVDNSSNQM